MLTTLSNMQISNKTLGIIAGAIVVGAILHIEYRVTTLASKVDAMADIINTNELIKHTPQDRDCLTKNIYYEARGERVEGKYAVAHVTINRVKSGQWGNSVCKVVYAKKQFSWTNQRTLAKPDPQGWAEAREVAVNTLNGARVRGLDRSMFYHATYVNPKWVDKDHYVGQIGRHKFYNRAKDSNVYI